MIKLPEKITICRIPFTVIETDGKCSYESSPDTQEIKVTGDAATPRKRQYLMWEIAHMLLTASGMKNKDADRYHAQVGSVLNRLIVDNNLDFVKSRTALPNMVWINGIPYAINYGDYEELKEENLGGQITYDPCTIQIMVDLKPEIKRYVIIHEITHGLLFEANAWNYASREPFVEALSWQLLYFLQDNDLSKLKPEGE